MRKSKFNQTQITQLLKNKHITKCSPTNITYANQFKVLAIKQYAEGMTADQIFEKAGLKIELVGKYVPKNCLKLWRKKFKDKGENGLLIEERGHVTGIQRGRPKTKGMTDAERIKRLEIENAYLKAKNDFLVKLRAQEKS